MIKKYKYIFFYSLIPIFLLSLHYKLIKDDPLMMRDDIILISGVSDSDSFLNYIERVREGILYDIQPIRDITFYLNLKLVSWSGFGAFHLTNILLLLGIFWVFRKNLKTLGISELAILVATWFLVVHPVINSSTAWVANRKHLLSILFLMFYIRENLKMLPSGKKSFLWCALSFFSQPLTVFIPIGLILYRKFLEHKKIQKWDWAIIVLTFIVLGMNLYFYSTNIRFAGRNSVDTASAELGMYILRLGRVAVQLLIPVNLAVEYNVGNPITFVGIFLTVVIVYIYLKFEKNYKRSIIYCLLLSTLFPVLKWGPRDAYLITTLLLTAYFLAIIFDHYRTKKFWPFFLVPYFIFLTFFSIKFTSMWSHDVILHRVSYETEGGAENYLRYIGVLAIYNKEKAYDLYKEATETYPHYVGTLPYQKKAEALYNTPQWSDEEKLQEFKKNKNPDIFSVFFEMKLLEKLKKNKEAANARKALLHSLEDPTYKYEFWQSMCLAYVQDCKDLGVTE